MLITVDKIEHNYDPVALMNNKKLKRNKTFSMKINLIMLSILKYSICSIFLLNFIYCTNVDDPRTDDPRTDDPRTDDPPIVEGTAGFIFTPASREVNVTEGMQVDYTVKLSSKPMGDVTLNVNPAIGLSSGTTSLTFTPSNWNATQTVTITADDNNYIGVATQLQINHDVSSADSKYSSIVPGQVTVNITDDDGDTGNIVISTNMLSFNDIDGATGSTYTLSLSHDPAPGKTVRVSLGNGNSADLQVSPMVVNFGETTGRSPQTITVTRVGGASGMIIADVTAAISHTVATGVSYDPNITTFANSSGDTVNVTIIAPVVDANENGLIEINNAVMLNNVRYDLAGASYKTSSAQVTGNIKGCPTSGCNGYELTADIDLLSLLDTGGDDGIDKTTVGIDRNADGDTTDAGEQVSVIDTALDRSWMPIGDESAPFTGTFTGTFEGGEHTIANLWVNVNVTLTSGSAYAGLFGVTDGTSVEIRNVKIISGSIYASSSYSYSGGLVGYSKGSLTIMDSHFSGSGVFSATHTGSFHVPSSDISYSYSGGLVGRGSGTVSITKSSFSGSGGVSTSSISSVYSVNPSYSYSGGLVGQVDTVIIINSYFSGEGKISSSSTSPENDTLEISSLSYSGGLVGSGVSGIVSITNSYFSGGEVSSFSESTPTIGNRMMIAISSESYSGGLVGNGGSNGIVNIKNSYFSGEGKISSSSESRATTSQISSSESKSYSGGLIGLVNTGKIEQCYFSVEGGEVSSSSESSSSESYSGGLVGSGTMTITDGYWNTETLQKITNGMTDQSPKRAQGNSSSNPSGATGLTLAELMGTMGTYPSGLPHGATEAWTLGSVGGVSQLPAVKLCVSPTVNPTTNVVTCTSYGDLLAGQRP